MQKPSKIGFASFCIKLFNDCADSVVTYDCPHIIFQCFLFVCLFVCLCMTIQCASHVHKPLNLLDWTGWIFFKKMIFAKSNKALRSLPLYRFWGRHCLLKQING